MDKKQSGKEKGINVAGDLEVVSQQTNSVNVTKPSAFSAVSDVHCTHSYNRRER